MSDAPKPLLQKLLFTFLLGIGFILVGAAYYMYISPDRILLILSILVFAASLVKGGLLLYRIKIKNYEIVEGVCVGFTTKPLSKFRGVKFMDAQGNEATVRLPKNHKFMIEHRYRLYFSKNTAPPVGSEFIDTRLTTDSFLGYEEIS